MAALSIQERKRLRQIGHALNPVVMLGDKGLTESVVEELNRALNDHELIKVKVTGEDREARAATITKIANVTGAEVVQTIGKIALLYKKAAKQNPKLSNLVRHAHLSN
jgi:RNA-binding protein